MKKRPARRPTPTAANAATASVDSAFDEVVSLIHAARQRAVQAVNTELIALYWRTRQFFEAYRHEPKLSTALRELQPRADVHFEDAYQKQLPDKKLLQAKLHEFYALSAPEIPDAEPAARSPRKTKGRKA